MSRVKLHSPSLLVKVLREGIEECQHRVEAVVCDSRGRTLMVAGDAERSTFVRSSLKPFQALAVTTTGTLERFDLGDRDLAIICASHAGTPPQARQAFHVLWQAELEPTLLQCPIPPGRSSALEHNCSGKHAGMLAVCRHCGWSPHDYMERQHPIQQLILSQVAECLGMPPAELLTARDDCGVPTYLLQLRQMAHLYAQLASGDRLELERIVRAMTHYPDFIAGEGQFDTELMRIAPNHIVSKGGAEGVQCIGLVGEGMGLAIKVQDGSKRAKHAVAIHLLRQMGWITPTQADALADGFMVPGPVSRMEVLGEIVMV